MFYLGLKKRLKKTLTQVFNLCSVSTRLKKKIKKLTPFPHKKRLKAPNPEGDFHPYSYRKFSDRKNIGFPSSVSGSEF